MSLSRLIDGIDSDNDAMDFAITLKITPGEKNNIQSPVMAKDAEEVETQNIKLVLNEVLPNPVGDDSKNEFIEIYNPSTSTVSLLGWKIVGTNKEYTIREKVLGPLSYAVFLRSVTGISLRNTGGDTVQLYNFSGDLVDTLSYQESAGEGQSFGRGLGGILAWSLTPSLGEENIVTSVELDDDTKMNDGEIVASTVEKTSPKSASIKKIASAKKKAVKKVAGIKIKSGIHVNLSQIREQDKGTVITTTGTVAVLPGVLGTQYFYIVDESAGVQIFMSKKDFPNLLMGDLLQVTGQVSESYGETRVNVQSKSQIEVLGHGAAPLAQGVELASIAESFEGALVQSTAQVTDVKTSYLYIDDGTAEIKVYFKRGSGITRDDVKLGSTVKITGIVSAVQGGYQILPRSKDDLLLIASSTETLAPSVSGSSNSMKKIMTAIFAVMSSILLAVLVKTQIPPKSPLAISKNGNRR
jgi:DNA/RNA endonuclease YhcR with UshA esterase domain